MKLGPWLTALVVLIDGAVLISNGAVARATKMPWKVDEPTAQRLAAEGHYGADREVDAFDYNPGANPPFFIYEGVNDAPVEGSFGYFAVNPWTGDVWALWGCHRLSTSALRKSRASIRRRFTAAEMKQYTKLRQLKPECTFED